ncbi:SigE family RNA polymerase sigma factor [Nocardioides hungaricus]
MADRREDFVEFAEARRAQLRRFAYSMCGDWHQAEDVVQIALSKLYQAWPRVHRSGREDAYTRKIVARVAVDESRRPWRREVSMDLDGDDDRAPTKFESPHDIVAALQALPPRQRQVVVLRHWMDLSVEETAETLGIPQGTVKSQTSRALARLNQLLTHAEHEVKGDRR